MAGPSDLVHAPPTQSRSTAPEGFGPPLDEDTGPVNLFQEINERRARIENAELLRRLRGL